MLIAWKRSIAKCACNFQLTSVLNFLMLHTQIFRVMTDRQLNMDDAVTALTVSKALQRIRAEKRVSITRAIDAVTASISAESLLGKLSLADSVEDSTSRVRCSVNDTVLAPTHHVHSVQSATCTVPKHGLSCAAVPRTSESKIGATKTKNGRRRTSVRSPGDSTEETETLCENDESAKGQVPLGKPSLDLDKEIAQKVDLPPSQNEINSNRTAKRTGSQTKQQVTCKRQRSTNGGAIGNTPSGLGTE